MEKKISVYTFEVFWQRFHYLTNYYKRRKTACRRLWDGINCLGKKKALIDSVNSGIKVNAYDYLKNNINKF